MRGVRPRRGTGQAADRKGSDAARAEGPDRSGKAAVNATRRVNPSKGAGKAKARTLPRPAKRRDRPARQRTGPSAKPGTTTGANTKQKHALPRQSAQQGQGCNDRRQYQGQANAPAQTTGAATQKHVGPRVVECATQTTLQQSVLSSRNGGAGQRQFDQLPDSTPAWWCRGISPWCRFRRSRC